MVKEAMKDPATQVRLVILALVLVLCSTKKHNACTCEYASVSQKKPIQRLLNARQFALKLLANVTYG